MDWMDFVVDVLSGLAVAIPLIIGLVKYVKEAIKEKNWKKLMDLVMNLMVQAEAKFDNGVERKEWVLMMVKASADTIDYDIDLNVVAEMIDSLCSLTKVVNPPVVTETEAIEE